MDGQQAGTVDDRLLPPVDGLGSNPVRNRRAGSVPSIAIDLDPIAHVAQRRQQGGALWVVSSDEADIGLIAFSVDVAQLKGTMFLRICSRAEMFYARQATGAQDGDV